MTEQQNIRPSASREIAVKKLVWVDLTGSGYALNAVTIVGIYNIRINGPEEIWLHKDGTGIGGRFRYIEEAKAFAQADCERRILSAIDTTPGNTDPIAKYDDELRKVQGGWRDFWDWWSEDGCAIDTDPDVSWYDKRRDFAEIAFEAGRISAPTEHPTEQPVYETCSKCSGSGQIIGDAGEPTLCSECKGDTVAASEQPSVRDAARVLLDYLPNYAMENAALESRASDDEGEFASLSDLLDFSGQNKAYTVVREALAAALRSLAQEGE